MELFEFETEEAIPPGLEKLERLAYRRGLSPEGDRAYKMLREFHRLLGFLRFDRDITGVYTARCAPDFFVLPLLADHFFLRFGTNPWMIVDEKRGAALVRERGKTPELRELPPERRRPSPEQTAADTSPEAEENRWEELWRNYHHSVNNEDRANPELQARFVPRRYRKYLPEFSP